MKAFWYKQHLSQRFLKHETGYNKTCGSSISIESINNTARPQYKATIKSRRAPVVQRDLKGGRWECKGREAPLSRGRSLEVADGHITSSLVLSLESPDNSGPIPSPSRQES